MYENKVENSKYDEKGVFRGLFCFIEGEKRRAIVGDSHK